MKNPIKNSNKRHELILESLQKNKKAMIHELVELTGVSGVTIRKDLKFLEGKNLLFRIQGGASLNNPYIVERSINIKENINSKEKQQIARKALELIESTDSIIIGSGTTAFALAQALSPTNPLTVITPATKVTLELSGKPNLEILQLGGLIRPNSSSVAGQRAENTLSEISSDIFFMGVDGIDLDFGFSITNLQEAPINQKMIRSSQRVAILADSTKIGKRGLGKVCDFNDVHYIITDSKIKQETIKKIEEFGIKVIIANNN